MVHTVASLNPFICPFVTHGSVLENPGNILSFRLTWFPGGYGGVKSFSQIGLQTLA